jgi:lysozyme
MRIDQAGIDFIKEAEGVKPFFYLDVAGLPTIGAGHLLTRDELTSGKIMLDGYAYKYHDGLSDSIIDRLLMRDLHIAEIAVKTGVSVNLTQNQYNALVSFAFNVGIGAFKKSTLLKWLNDGGYDKVPTQMRRWIFSAGQQIKGLKNRRGKEIALWSKKDEKRDN